MCDKKFKFNVSDFFKSQKPATLDEMQRFINLEPNDNNIGHLSRKQCLDDLEQLHFLLKHLYAGYYSLGEDYFCNAFEKMQKQVNNKTTLLLKDFIFIIYEGLDGLIDRHFCFGLEGKFKIRIFDDSKLDKLYFNDVFKITQIGKNYYFEDKKILNVEGQNNIENFIKPILNEKGELFLGFIVYAKENKILHVKLEGNQTIDVVLKQAQEPNEIKKQSQLFDLEKDGDILCIKNQTLMYNKFQNFDFSKCDWNDAQFRILDIRNNGGGSDNITKNIMKSFGFENSGLQISGFDLCSRFDKRDCSKQEFIKNYFNNWEKSIKNDTPGVLRVFVGGNSESIKTSEKPLIIIQNKNCASAAESFIEEFYNHKNVIFLGENTGGYLSFGNIRNYYLNNSDLVFTFGSSMFLDNRFGFIEGKGYSPDIYFPYKPDLIVNATKAFINNNLMAKKFCEKTL